jgi:hypothetical protein
MIEALILRARLAEGPNRGSFCGDIGGLILETQWINIESRCERYHIDRPCSGREDFVSYVPRHHLPHAQFEPNLC